MGIPQFLALNNQTGTPQLQYYRGGTVTPIGTAFASAETLGVTTQPGQRVVHFYGNLYAFVRGAVYISTDAGQIWTVSFTPPLIDAAPQIKTIAVIMLNGTPTLCIGYKSTDSTISLRMSRTTDGVTWTNSATFSSFADAGFVGFQSETIYGGQLYALSPSVGRYLVMNFGTLTASVSGVIPGVGGLQELDFTIFNNILYAVVPNTATNVAFYRIAGTSFVAVTSFNFASGNLDTTNGKNALFVDGTNMYALVFSAGTALVWHLLQLTSALAITEITSTVLPSTMLANQTNASRCRVVVDTVTDPATPAIYIYHTADGTVAANAAQMWSVYQWNGNAAQLTLQDTGGLVAHAIPWNTYSQGTTVSQQNGSLVFGPHAEIVGTQTLASGVGSIRVSFKLFSTSGSQLVTVRGFFTDVLGEYATSSATFTDPSAGNLNGNVIENLTANNGLTTYEVTWSSGSDGIAQQEAYKFVLNVRPQ